MHRLGGPVRTAVVGCGPYAGFFARSVKGSEDLSERFDFYVACDIEPAKGEAYREEHGFEHFTPDYEEVLSYGNVDLVVFTTPHNCHAEQIIKALEAGKNTYCEKPLTINPEECCEVTEALYQHPDLVFILGLNRAFAPDVQIPISARRRYGLRQMELSYKMQSGGTSYWNNPATGGRIIGEFCHVLDVATQLKGKKPVIVRASSEKPHNADVDIWFDGEDDFTAHLILKTNGDPSLPKEQFEVRWPGGRVFRSPHGYRGLEVLGFTFEQFDEVVDRDRLMRRLISLKPEKKIIYARSLDDLPPEKKGHEDQWRAMADAVQRGEPNQGWVRKAIGSNVLGFAVLESIATGEEVVLSDRYPNLFGKF